jgi:transcriptional regulator with XRE-family HTH domain
MQIVRVFRALFKVGQAELALATGISARELARIETGEAFPSRETGRALDIAIMRILVDRIREFDIAGPVI